MLYFFNVYVCGSQIQFVLIARSANDCLPISWVGHIFEYAKQINRFLYIRILHIDMLFVKKNIIHCIRWMIFSI